jgi:hypothetical protein
VLCRIFHFGKIRIPQDIPRQSMSGKGFVCQYPGQPISSLGSSPCLIEPPESGFNCQKKQAEAAFT